MDEHRSESLDDVFPRVSKVHLSFFMHLLRWDEVLKHPASYFLIDGSMDGRLP